MHEHPKPDVRVVGATIIEDGQSCDVVAVVPPEAAELVPGTIFTVRDGMAVGMVERGMALKASADVANNIMFGDAERHGGNSCTVSSVALHGTVTLGELRAAATKDF